LDEEDDELEDPNPPLLPRLPPELLEPNFPPELELLPPCELEPNLLKGELLVVCKIIMSEFEKKKKKYDR